MPTFSISENNESLLSDCRAKKMYVIVNKQVKFLPSQYIGTCKSAYTKGYALNWVLTCNTWLLVAIGLLSTSLFGCVSASFFQFVLGAVSLYNYVSLLTNQINGEMTMKEFMVRWTGVSLGSSKEQRQSCRIANQQWTW